VCDICRHRERRRKERGKINNGKRHGDEKEIERKKE